MLCIYCRSKTRIVNSRLRRRSNTKWRRHECTACHTVFTSLERADLTGSLVIRKPKAAIEPFNRDKLFLSIYEACRHRKTAANDAVHLTETVIAKLLRLINTATLERGQVVQVTSEVLKRFDKAAATVYLAYHPL